MRYDEDWNEIDEWADDPDVLPEYDPDDILNEDEKSSYEDELAEWRRKAAANRGITDWWKLYEHER